MQQQKLRLSFKYNLFSKNYFKITFLTILSEFLSFHALIKQYKLLLNINDFQFLKYTIPHN